MTRNTIIKRSADSLTVTAAAASFLTMSLVDHKLVRYPFSIVWTPIPLLTWLFPFIGHMGIADSNGVIRDFAGPYHVSVSRTACCIMR
jgi:hypothetical protein